MLILVGAGIIVFEATRRLVNGSEVEDARRRHRRRSAFSALANLVVSTFLQRRAVALDSPALEGDAAHLRTDALTSVGVLVGLALVAGHRRGGLRLDRGARASPRRSSSPGFRILTPLVPGARRRGAAGRRARPDRGGDRGRARARAEIAGYHKLRARRAGARRYIDLHVQFRSGTTLEQAHALAHSVRDAIEAEIPTAEVLIHVEPEQSFRPPEQEARGPYRAGLSAQVRLTAAARPTATAVIE